MNHQDEQIVCADCGASFIFSGAEAAFYAERNLASPPKRCKPCRAARKERGQGAGGHAGGPRGGGGGGYAGGSRSGGGGGGYAGGPRGGGGYAGGPRGGDAPSRDRRPGGGGGGGDRPFQPRYTGDVNEYRSPMQDGAYYSQPAWGRGDARPGGGRGAPPRDDGNYRAPAFGGDAPRRGAVGRSEPRRSGPTRGAPLREVIATPRDAGRGPPREAGRGPQRDAPPRDAAAGEPRSQPRAAKARAQAEQFDITCKTCGGVAQVPFKPIEGRDVFCQPCYRARKPLRAAGDPT